MAETVARIPDNVAPTDHCIGGTYGQQLHASAVKDGSNELSSTFQGWTFDKTYIAPLSRNRVYSQTKTLGVLLSCWNNAHFFHGCHVSPPAVKISGARAKIPFV